MKKTPPRNAKKVQSNELNTLFAELKAEYLETFTEKITTIEKAWQAKNRKQLESEYHKIKGTGATYGVNEATQVAEVLETLCHEGSNKLGMCVLVSIHLFKKIENHYKTEAPFEMSKDAAFKFLRRCQDELESA